MDWHDKARMTCATYAQQVLDHAVSEEEIEYARGVQLGGLLSGSSLLDAQERLGMVWPLLPMSGVRQGVRKSLDLMRRLEV